jgi:SAM-dependent methyltransferase
LAASISKKVSIRERSILINGLVGIHAYRANRALLAQRFAQGGYTARETPHFLLLTREEAPSTILAHWFAPHAIDADLGHYFLQELKPLGILNNAEQFGTIFAAIVGSLSPYDTQQALELYARNTLRRYSALLKKLPEDGYMTPMQNFACLYKRVMNLLEGETLLDAGCSFGFLPLLVAEHVPACHSITAIDIQADPFPIVEMLAKERGFRHIAYEQADILHPAFRFRGPFDTVVILHVLEHFKEDEMYLTLKHLLEVTTKRLIIAVPFEKGSPEQVYGHEQLFDRVRLEALGEWCVEQMHGQGTFHYEDCADGLLVIQRKN